MQLKELKNFLAENGVESTLVNRIGEESPNINDVLKNREVDLLINTPTKANDAQRDGFKMRRTAIEYGVDVLTSLDTINAILRMQDSHIDESKLDVFDVSKI